MSANPKIDVRAHKSETRNFKLKDSLKLIKNYYKVRALII